MLVIETDTDAIAALHRTLERNPNDSFTRLVLADALDEVGSPLGAGYRWMAERGVRSVKFGEALWMWSDPAYFHSECSVPPSPVWDRLREHRPQEQGYENWKDYDTRRLADDAFSRAFAELTPEEIAAL